MDGSIPLILMLIVIVLLLLNIVVYAYGAAVQNISDSEIEAINKKDKKTYEKIVKIIDEPNIFINTVQTVTIMTTLVTGIFICVKANTIFMSIVFLVLWAIFCLVCCITLPKKLARRNAKKYVYQLTNIVYILMLILTPILMVITLITNILLKIFGLDPNEPLENVTEEDIMSVINEGHEQGVLLASEAEMINNIVEFGDKEAKDIMTHRTSIVSLDGEMTLREAVQFILNKNNSRFPVYIDNIDNILGIINFRDIMTEYSKEVNRNTKICDIRKLIREAKFIPETKKINNLFKIMQSEKMHMVIVMDEYGQTSGIVAMEDILEEIVGNILDEYDKEDINILKKEDGSYIVKGKTPLEDICEEIGLHFDDECETLSGFLTSKFERILANDEHPEIMIDGVHYKILSVKNRMISSVQIVLPEPEINAKVVEETEN